MGLVPDAGLLSIPAREGARQPCWLQPSTPSVPLLARARDVSHPARYTIPIGTSRERPGLPLADSPLPDRGADAIIVWGAGRESGRGPARCRESRDGRDRE